MCILHVMASPKKYPIWGLSWGFAYLSGAFLCWQICIPWLKWQTEECVIQVTQRLTMQAKWELFVYWFGHGTGVCCHKNRAGKETKPEGGAWIGAFLGCSKMLLPPCISLKWGDTVFLTMASNFLIATICLFLLTKMLIMGIWLSTQWLLLPNCYLFHRIDP